MQIQQYRNCTNILHEVISTLKMEYTFLGKINFLTGYLPISQKHVKEPPSLRVKQKKGGHEPFIKAQNVQCTCLIKFCMTKLKMLARHLQF